jgi:hypothetical protein
MMLQVVQKTHVITVKQTAAILNDDEDKQINPAGIYTLRAENREHALACFHRIAPSGYWEFYELANAGFYMAP